MKEQGNIGKKDFQESLVEDGRNRLDLIDSRTACTFMRTILLFCSIFAVALLVEQQLHLQFFRQSVSLLLMGAQVFMVYLIHLDDNKTFPSPKVFFNKQLIALLVFHVHTIFGASYSMYVYIAIHAFLIWRNIKIKNLNKKAHAQELVFIIFILSITILIQLDSEGIIVIGWGKIIIVPAILLVLIQIHVLFVAVIQGLNKYCFHHRKVHIFQRISSFIALTYLFFTIYILVLEQFVSKQSYGVISKTFFLTAILLFVIITYYKEEFILLFSDYPKFMERRSHNNFEQPSHEIKMQRQIQCDTHYCVFCYEQQAVVCFPGCLHLSYCEACFLKVKLSRQKLCPICRGMPDLRKKAIVIELGEWQWKGYSMKFHIQSKLSRNQYFIKRELNW